jgi:colicin import membrane protein
LLNAHFQEEVKNMAFILITGSIMSISIFLIYRLCRFFKIEMKWISLVLCAIMAFIVNGMAITMSPFLDRTHYLRLGILVVTAAALVTIFNERMLRREEALAGGYTVLPTEQLPVKEEPPAEDDMLLARRKKSAAPAAVEEPPAAEPVSVEENAPMQTDSPKESTTTKKTAADIQAAQLAVKEAEAAAKVIAEQAEAEAKAEAAAEDEMTTSVTCEGNVITETMSAETPMNPMPVIATTFIGQCDKIQETGVIPDDD